MQKILIRNGKIVTMNKNRDIFYGDILIEGNKIKRIDAKIDINADKVIDASNCAVIPGLIQTHVHLTQRIFQGLADDMQLLDWLMKKIWPLEANHTYESNYLSAKLGIAELLSGGTTSIIDMGTVNHTEAIFESICETGIRAIGGKCMMDYGDNVPSGLKENTEDSIKESVRLAEKWHGKNGLLEYAFAPRFVVSCTDELFKKLVVIAKDMNLKVHTHASENQGEIELVEKDRGMRNIVYLHKIGLTGENLILAHCIWLDDEELKILSDTGTMISHCPSSNLKLASGIAPIPELLESGCNVSIAADGSPCNNNLDIFTEMRNASLIQKAKTLNPTVMPAEKVFEMATLGGAKAMGKENQIGSLEEGKLADIVVVNLNTLHNIPNFGRDVIAQIVYSVKSSDVQTTIVNGRILMENRKLLTINTEELLKEIESIKHVYKLEEFL
jgi:5-methylthioadenosine/S-adenosylhomocysteine deaminase